MPFEDNARLDPSQVEDARGQGGSGGFGGFGGVGGGPSGPMIAGGGGLGVLVLLALLLLGVLNPADLSSISSYGQPAYQQPVTTTDQTIQQCQTGADANRRLDCRMVGYVNSIQDFWGQDFARHGQQYAPAKLVLFSGTFAGGCGYASEAQGPFYCPVDQKVYLDLAFFQDLQQRFGAQGGPFAQGYVVAHEYGHHVQDLLGVLSNNRSNSLGPHGGSVQTELQADCLAGVWARHAADTGFLTPPSNADVADALNAAAAVGDDRIQSETTGQVTPETWSHGSSQQRDKWFQTGYQAGDRSQCNTGAGAL
jgi:predicted metalloprotease